MINYLLSSLIGMGGIKLYVCKLSYLSCLQYSFQNTLELLKQENLMFIIPFFYLTAGPRLESSPGPLYAVPSMYVCTVCILELGLC